MSCKNFSLLYIEDEQELRESMKHSLKYLVKELYVAQDAFEAFEVYKNKHPDILMTDLLMPQVNGIELVKKIRKIDQNIPIIMLTANSDVDNLLVATELKLTKYVLKPTDKNDIVNALSLAAKELATLKMKNSPKLVLKNNYTWDFEQKSLYKDDNEIKLTPKERETLNLLLSNLNSTITYDTLIDKIWFNSDNYGIDAIKTLVKNLRRKLPKDTIENVYATGFKIRQ